MALVTTTTYTGASGMVYDFEVFSLSTEFNPVSGVYVLSALTGTTLLTQRFAALYVGQTGDLNDRLNASPMNHDGYERSRNAGMTNICVHRCDWPAERFRIETDLRHSLNPPCNRQPVPRVLTDIFSR